MNVKPKTMAAQVQLAEAIAQVREAMLLAGKREFSHFQKDQAPCEQAYAAEDAAVRHALLSSEDAMLQVLQSMPPMSAELGPLVN